jgi:hypothetical protein
MGASSPKMRIEKRKSARLPFLRVWTALFCEKIIGEMFGFLDYFMYLCNIKRGGFGRGNNPSNSPFKTCKIMNKTVRKILQAISYLITLFLGAAGGSTLM